jgi:hypothetical protein
MGEREEKRHGRAPARDRAGVDGEGRRRSRARPSSWSRVGAFVVLAGAALLTAACRPRPRMCAATAECGAAAVCVAGRCQAEGGTPAIGSASRLVFEATDVAYVRAGGGALAPVVWLGRADDREAALLLRFAVSLPPEASVVEAYVLLEQPVQSSAPLSSGGPRAGEETVSLHLLRVAEPWDARSVRWERAPRFEDVRAPSTSVHSGAGRLIRLDARPLVSRWRRREAEEAGIAVVAATRTATGVALATGAPGAPAMWGGLRPRLELYVR